MYESISADYEVAGIRVRIQRVRPAAPVRAGMVLIHGYAEHSGRYADFVQALARHGVATTTCDLPGHGLSGGVPGEFPTRAELDMLIAQLSAIVRHDAGGAPTFLFGHSLGGLFVVVACSRQARDFDGVILSSPVVGRWNAIDAFLAAKEIPPSLVRAHHLSRRDDFAASYDNDPLIHRGPIARSTLREAAEALAELSALSAPLAGRRVLWIHGSADRIVPLEQTMCAIAELGITDLEARVFRGARHEVLHDDSVAEALRTITDFIERQRPVTGHHQGEKVEPRIRRN